MNDPHTLPDRLADARANAEKLRAALVRATAHAAATEVARCDAEAKHCSAVADALVDDGKPPAKPPALSALQAADMAADMALVEIENRLKSAQGELVNAAHAVLAAEVDALATARHGEVRKAIPELAGTFQRLIHAAGRNAANHLLGEVGRLAYEDHSNAPLVRIATALPEVSNVAEFYRNRAAELHVVPTTLDEITSLFKEI